MKMSMMIGALLCAALVSQSKADKPASLQPIYNLTAPTVPVSITKVASLGPIYNLCEDFACDCPDGTCDRIGCRDCPCEEKHKKARGYVREDKPDLRTSLERIAVRLEALEKKPREVVKPEVKPESKPAKTGYPINNRPRYHRKVGGRNVAESDEELVQHFQTGEHAGKFPVDWLRGLAREEKESLHTDAHEGKVQWDYVLGTDKSQSKPGDIRSKPGEEVMLDLNGRQARYSLQVVTERKQVCTGGRCSFQDVQSIRPVFLGWK